MATTIREALTSMIDFPLPLKRIDKALIDGGLNGEANYTKSDEQKVDLCTAGLILTICTAGNISEGGYSLSISDKEALMKTRSLLLLKWGVSDNTVPEIEDGTGLW